MTPIENVLSKLDNVKPTGDGWQATCPCHDDRNPSLSIAENEKGVVLLCDHGGCNTEDILYKIGLDYKDLYPDSIGSTKRIVEQYDYRDEQGTLLYQVVRLDPKGFFFRQPDGKDGWTNNVKGVRRVPYRLPEICEAVTQGKVVYIVEGEKDANALVGLGFEATCNPGGAGKWQEDFSTYFVGAEVVIIPDNDEKGESHAQNVASKLYGIAGSIRLLPLEASVSGDVSSWLANGGTAEEIQSQAQKAVEWSPKLDDKPERATSFTVAELLNMDFGDAKWVVEGLIPEGCTVLAGRAKIGKTFFALNLSMAKSDGSDAYGAFQVGAGRVLYIALEGTNKNLKHRLAEMLGTGVPPENVHIEREWPQGAKGIKALEEWMDRYPDTELIVIDTLKGFREKRSSGKSVYDLDYEDLKPISDFCERYGVNAICLHHSNKGTWDDPFDAISGSMGLRGAVDSEAILIDDSHGNIILNARGRDLEQIEKVFTFDSETLTWNFVGDAQDVQKNRERQLIYDVLRDANADPLLPKDIFPLIVDLGYSKTDSAMRHMLRTMVKDPDSGIVGDGKKGYAIAASRKDTSDRGSSHSSQTSQGRVKAVPNTPLS